MMKNVSTSFTPKSDSPRRPRSFYGPGKFKWAIYPDYWKDSWGPKPMLGTVFADDEFYAEREAYNRNLVIVNYTFRPQPVLIGEATFTNNTNRVKYGN